MPNLQYQKSVELGDIFNRCWEDLVNAAKSPIHPFHFPVFGTINSHHVELRTVVLRDVVPNDGCLIFYTDYRSPKIQQIKINPHVSWLFYNPDARIQIRIKALASIHHLNETSSKYWSLLKEHHKRDYSTFLPPSNPIEETVEYLDKGNEEKLFENFAVISTEVVEIDWLMIKSNENKRARFIKDKSGFISEWLVP